MAKNNRSLGEFTQNIYDDFNARRDEVIVMKDLVEKNKNQIDGVIYAKYLIVCLYANWEGFIKYASECFIEFLSHKNLKNSELDIGILAISNLEKIKEYMESNVALKIKILQDLFDNMS